MAKKNDTYGPLNFLADVVLTVVTLGGYLVYKVIDNLT